MREQAEKWKQQYRVSQKEYKEKQEKYKIQMDRVRQELTGNWLEL